MKNEEIIVLLENMKERKSTTQLEREAINEAVTILKKDKEEDKDKETEKIQ